MKRSTAILNPIDDILFNKMAEEKEFCEEILRVILDDPSLIVIDHHPQEMLRNLKGRSLQLDALCRLSDGRIVNVEVQKYRSEAHQKRVRYHSALLTSNYTPQGVSFSDVPNVCIIYIAKFDIFGAEKSIYHIKRIVQETGQEVYNGLEEIYVNTEVRDGTAVSELMEIFTEDAAYSEDFPVTSKLKRLYREEAPEMIYTQWDKYRDELREEAIREGREIGIKQGIEQGVKQGIEQGVKQGIEQGIKQGVAQGREEGIAATLQKLAGALQMPESELKALLESSAEE